MKNIDLILDDLRLNIGKITLGYYPKDILLSLGKEGFYKSFLNNKENGLFQSIQNIALVSKICGNTGFCVWCQEVLLWYLLNSTNKNPVISNIFNKLSDGESLGGSGLSNPVKSFAKIEKNKINAKKVDGGYLLSGTLPWVSNIEFGHYFAAIVECEGIFSLCLIECDNRAKIAASPLFCALEGSGTLSICLDNYFLSNDYILAKNVLEVLDRILPSFVLLQGGIALGLIDCAIEKCNESINLKGGINYYLPKIDDFIERRNLLFDRTKQLAKTPYDTSKDFFHSSLRLKLDFINLALELATNCMLSLGTKGYFKNSPASKLLLESHFIAIVTPSLKHINKILQH